jgi:ABC-type Zn uptake system ZnuABC Zn-binding protein ZnuA
MRTASQVTGYCVLVLVAVGCGSKRTNETTEVSNAASSAKIVVVTTTTQLTDFVSVVGGDKVQVIGLVKANTDPHDFEATPADLEQIANANVIVKNGVGLEKWFDATIKSAEPIGTVIDVSSGVTLRKGSSEDPDGDPHIWQNPQNVKIMTKNIADALATADPAHATTYANNQAAYATKLDELDSEIAKQIDGLTNKKLVTNHDAFGYYIDRYGLVFIGSVIPSFDTAAELSAVELQSLVAKITAEDVKAIFSESSLPPKTAKAIGTEAGVKVVDGVDALYGDALGASGSEGATYLEMMRHNTNAIVSNLAG